MMIREGTVDDAELLAAMFRQMWLDNGVAAETIVEDAEPRVRDFLVEGRSRRGLRLFFAVEAGVDVGGAVCQRFAGLYPDILAPEVRRYGYIWGVYVQAAARRRGLGKGLTERCVEALREAGCTHALLHAAPPGVGVYRGLGFESTNEMRLEL